MSRHIPYEIWFNDKKMTNILKDDASTITVDANKGILKIREFGSKYAFHSIEKSVVIFPEYVKNTENIIHCNVNATMNWLGVLTMGLLAPVRKIIVNIEY